MNLIFFSINQLHERLEVLDVIIIIIIILIYAYI